MQIKYRPNNEIKQEGKVQSAMRAYDSVHDPAEGICECPGNII